MSKDFRGAKRLPWRLPKSGLFLGIYNFDMTQDFGREADFIIDVDSQHYRSS